MTPVERKALRNGATNAALWGGVVALASGGKPAGLALAVITAVVTGAFSTGLRLPARLLRDAASSLWSTAKGATRFSSGSIPVKYVVPLLLATSFAGRGCDGVTIPDVKWPDIEWRNVVPIVTPDPPKVADPLWFIVVGETAEYGVEESRIVAATAFWQSLTAEGHHWRLYDDDQPEVKAGRYLESLAASGVMGNGLLILNGKTGEKIKAVPLPKSTAEIAALKTEITGR